MPTNTYNCPECNFKEEYIEGAHVAKENWHPEVCPECGKGKLEKVFDLAGNSIGIDFVGTGFFINDYGIHNWRSRMSKEDQAKVISGEKDPY